MSITSCELKQHLAENHHGKCNDYQQRIKKELLSDFDFANRMIIIRNLIRASIP
jgi:hypothetical protein